MNPYKIPFHITTIEQCIARPWPFPNVDYLEGNYGWVEERYELSESILCDHTGIGSPSEPAYTPDQLSEKLIELLNASGDKGIHIAIIDVGPFQLLLGVWKPKN